MFAAMLFAISIVALAQFALYYWRAVLAAVAGQPVSEGVLAAALPGKNESPVYAFEPLHPGVLIPGISELNMSSPEAVSLAIRNALSSVSPRSRFVTVVIPDTAVRVFVLDFDTLPARAAEAIPVLRFRLRKMVPFEVEHAGLSYQVLSQSKTEARVLVAVLPSNILEEYETVVRAAGYEQYEISNWAKPGFASRHNLKYWQREPYFGFGAGAHSFSGTQRWANVHDAAAYVSAIESGRSAVESVEPVTRASALGELQKEYVTASRVAGAGTLRLMFSQVLPNCTAPLIVQATLGFSSAILDAAALGFLGLGVQPPSAEWGAMLASARDYIDSAWWIVTMPGFSILISVLSINLLGDGLRDALDPKLKRMA